MLLNWFCTHHTQIIYVTYDIFAFIEKWTVIYDKIETAFQTISVIFHQAINNFASNTCVLTITLQWKWNIFTETLFYESLSQKRYWFQITINYLEGKKITIRNKNIILFILCRLNICCFADKTAVLIHYGKLK